MMKKYKWQILLSSVIILIPTVVGLIFWDKLPKLLTLHWGLDGKADGFGSPWIVVILLPLIMLLIYWICLFVTSKDKKQAGQNPKALRMIFWLMPAASLVSCGTIYAAALGKTLLLPAAICILLGVMFMVIGNYMPKCKQNYTLGIKIKWTLANEENWNATHRFAGKLYFVCGALLFPCVFLPGMSSLYVSLIFILPIALAPVIYSYLYYKKQLKSGSATKEDFKAKRHYPRWVSVVSILCVAAILAFCAVISFTGSIKIAYGEASFTVEATFYSDITIDYDEVTSVDYRDTGVEGYRVSGFASARLLMGWFQNEELGNYTRYTYGNVKAPCVVVTLGEELLVLGGETAADTRAIYEELIRRVGA